MPDGMPRATRAFDPAMRRRMNLAAGMPVRLRAVGPRAAFTADVTFSCWYCHAADSRAEDHQQGCPKLPAVSRAERLEIARAAEARWERAAVSQPRAAAAYVADIADAAPDTPERGELYT